MCDLSLLILLPKVKLRLRLLISKIILWKIRLKPCNTIPPQFQHDNYFNYGNCFRNLAIHKVFSQFFFSESFCRFHLKLLGVSLIEGLSAFKHFLIFEKDKFLGDLYASSSRVFKELPDDLVDNASCCTDVLILLHSSFLLLTIEGFHQLKKAKYNKIFMRDMSYDVSNNIYLNQRSAPWECRT